MRDVVVVGGGPVGVFAAALLAERGLDVIVWERRPTPADLSRAIGIHPPSLAAFERIDVADRIEAEAVLIGRGIARSNGRTLGTLSFAHVSSEHPHVASLQQHRSEQILATRLEGLAPGALRRGIELTRIDDLDPSQVRLQGRGPQGDVFESARFVIGADGARSTVRTLLGLGADLTPYPDPYVMGDFRDDTGEGHAAVVHLERDGVVESFPLPGGTRRYVAHVGLLSGRPDHRAPAPTPASFAELVHSRTGAALDASTNSMLSAFTTRRRFARRIVRGRSIVIGDAAHEISPIGGQGMNLGWLDAADLVPIVVAAVEKGRVDPVALDAFEQRRMQIARRAARQSEANMAMGRPSSRVRAGARDAGFGLLLATPARRALARTYAMAWA